MMKTLDGIFASVLFAAAGLTAATQGRADEISATQKFANDRLAAFGKGDVASLVAQYRDDAVVITPQGTLKGRHKSGE
jgi:ketosteroid isomerase-like protein